MPFLNHQAAEAPSGVRQHEVLSDIATGIVLNRRYPRFSSGDYAGMVLVRQYPEVDLEYLRRLSESQATQALTGNAQVPMQPVQQTAQQMPIYYMTGNEGAAYPQGNTVQAPTFDVPPGYQSGGDGVTHMEMAAQTAMQGMGVSPLLTGASIPEESHA